MNKRLYRYWYIVPLLLIAVLARDWAEKPQDAPLEETIDMTSTRADYYLEEFETRKLDANGLPRYTLNGATLIHYPADDVSEINWPNLTLYQQDSAWNLVSKQGRLTTNPEVFTLEGAVTMQRAATEDLAAIVIQTSNLRVYTIDNIVASDDHIEIRSVNWTLRAKGLESRIDDGTLSLMADVEGHYEIPKPN